MKIINHKNNLNRIEIMKASLIQRDKTVFTRKDFVNTTGASRYYFSQLVRSGLIIDTGSVFSNMQGAPSVYALASAFLPAQSKPQYHVTQEDVATLLKAKNATLLKHKQTMQATQKQIGSIERQKALLLKIKLR